MKRSTGLRSGRRPLPGNCRRPALGDIGLASGWQADNAGNTAIPGNHASGSFHWVQVPMARANGELVTGRVLGRIRNRSGADSQPLIVQAAPIPYLPDTLDTRQAVLTTHTHETSNGIVSLGSVSRLPIGPMRAAVRPTPSRARPRTSTWRACPATCRCTSA